MNYGNIIIVLIHSLSVHCLDRNICLIMKIFACKKIVKYLIIEVKRKCLVDLFCINCMITKRQDRLQ